MEGSGGHARGALGMNENEGEEGEMYSMIERLG